MFRKSISILFYLWTFPFYVVIADEMKCHTQVPENFTDSSPISVIITLLNNANNLIDHAKYYAACKAR